MLDDHFIPYPDIKNEIIFFWKKKRIFYNIIVGTFGVLVICFEMIFLNRSLFFLWEVSILSVLFGLFTNICYNLGGIVEKTFYKYFPILCFKDLGLLLFWIGTISNVCFIFFVEYNTYIWETSDLPPIMR
jgi:hypothetical protein